MKTYATINWQDGHIRLYPESRLDDADYRKITGTPYHFRWKRVIGAFEAPFSPYRFKLLQEMYGQMSANDGVWWGFDDYEEAVQCAKEASSTRSSWRRAVGVWQDIPREDYLLLAVAKEGVIFEPRKEEGQA